MKKKHTLVVGGTRGTGRVLVRTLAEENHILSVIGRRPASETDLRIPDVRYWLEDLSDQERLSETLDFLENPTAYYLLLITLSSLIAPTLL